MSTQKVQYVKNHPNVVSDFPVFPVQFLPPRVTCFGKNVVTFFLLVLFEILNICYSSDNPLSVFQKKFRLCLFPSVFTPFCEKHLLFWRKSLKMVGNRQNQKFLPKMKSLESEDVFSYPKCYQSSKIHFCNTCQSLVKNPVTSQKLTLFPQNRVISATFL